MPSIISALVIKPLLTAVVVELVYVIRNILIRKTNITVSPPLLTKEKCYEKYLNKM